ARLVTVGDGNLVGGMQVPLIGKHTPKEAFGKAPTDLQCSGGTASFKDLDGEAVAYAKPFFYVVGSHGCSRKKAKFHASTFIVARVRVDESGRLVNPDGSAAPAGSAKAETTYRLSEVLARGKYGEFFGKDLSEEINGLNVEGAAIVGTTLYVGLR